MNLLEQATRLTVKSHRKEEQEPEAPGLAFGLSYDLFTLSMHLRPNQFKAATCLTLSLPEKL